MSSLTVTEKEHWKDRIGRRIDRQIERIAASEPDFLKRIQDQARERALTELGLCELQAELDTLTVQQMALDRRELRAQQAMLATIRSIPVEAVEVGFSSSLAELEIDRAIAKCQAVHQEELLAEDPRGRKILELRVEKENVLDTVWLATSTNQIKDLWRKVIELLGEEHTAFQKEALAVGANGKEN